MSVAPGTYSGTLGVAYGENQEMRASVPVKVFLRKEWLKPALLAFLSVSLGLLVKGP